jgi:hypothetical protein
MIAPCCLYPEFRIWWFALPADQRAPIDSVLERFSPCDNVTQS